MKKIYIFICLLFFISIALNSEDNKIEKVTIGTDEWKPYISRGMNHYGVCSHIVEEAFALVDIEVEFKFRPWKRLLAESSNGKIDGISVWGGYDNWIDTHFGSDPLFTGDYVIWTKKGKSFNWKNPEELKGMTLGVLLGEDVPEQLKEAHEKGYLKISEVNTYEQNFKMLLVDHIDLLSVNKDTGNGIIRTLSKEDQDKLDMHPVPLRISFYRLLLNKKNSERSKLLLEKFNTGLHILKSQGRLKKMLEAADRGEYN